MEKRFNLFLYDGQGGGSNKHFDHLEDVMTAVKSFINYDTELLSQFIVTDNGKDITASVRSFVEKSLPSILRFRDLKVGDKLYVLGWYEGGYARVYEIIKITYRKEEKDMLIETNSPYTHYCIDELDKNYFWDASEEEDVFIIKEQAQKEVTRRITKYNKFLEEVEQIED